MKFSVIIPAWNEGPAVGRSLKRLREVSDSSTMELILVDGGSTDGTAAAAEPWVDRIVRLDAPNRGAQLHAGAKVATGDLFFFLHADTQPPSQWQERLEKFWLKDRAEPAAASVFSVDYGTRLSYRLVAAAQNMRTRVLQIAYGDQGFCTTADIYRKSGGFPELPLMEDVEFSRRLRALGRIELLPDPIWPSARSLSARGLVLYALRNRWLVLRYSMGADPAALWKNYYALRLQTPPPAPVETAKGHPFAGKFRRRTPAPAPPERSA